jgi:hypothetical protein
MIVKLFYDDSIVKLNQIIKKLTKSFGSSLKQYFYIDSFYNNDNAN